MYELSGNLASEFNSLQGQIRQHHRSNKRRTTYVQANRKIDELGMSIPVGMRNLAVALGWPEKAVMTPARWIRPAGYRQSGEGVAASALNDAFTGGYHATIERMAITSSLTHGCAFIFVTAGDQQGGEPAVVLSAKSAMSATVRLNMRTLSPETALEVTGKKSWVLYVPGRAYVIEDIRGRGRMVTREVPMPHSSRVACVPYVWGRSLESPMGRSRITGPVMGLTDVAIRTVLRQEVTAEGFASPRRALLGANEEAFKREDGTYMEPLEIVSSAIWGIPDYYDEDNAEWRRPNLIQLSQGSMQPHSDQLRTIAGLFAAETSIPKSQVGVTTENPASAEAIRIEEAPLMEIVQAELPSYRDARMQLAEHALAIIDGGFTDATRQALRGVHAVFEEPGTQTRAMQADAASKLIAALPWAADSDVALEMWGLTTDQVARLKDDRARAQARQGLMQLAKAEPPA